MMFKLSYGRFGLMILPMNFFMHIISPFILLSIMVLGIISVLGYVFQGGDLVHLLILLSVACIALLIERIIPTRTKLSSIGLTFVQYQLILLEGMIRYLTGNSLHKWQKVERKT
jgi:hypothetical protein